MARELTFVPRKPVNESAMRLPPTAVGFPVIYLNEDEFKRDGGFENDFLDDIRNPPPEVVELNTRLNEAYQLVRPGAQLGSRLHLTRLTWKTLKKDDQNGRRIAVTAWAVVDVRLDLPGYYGLVDKFYDANEQKALPLGPQVWKHIMGIGPLSTIDPLALQDLRTRWAVQEEQQRLRREAEYIQMQEERKAKLATAAPNDPRRKELEQRAGVNGPVVTAAVDLSSIDVTGASEALETPAAAAPAPAPSAGKKAAK